MSWKIHNVLNTLKTTNKCSEELDFYYKKEIAGYQWPDDPEEPAWISDNGFIWFMEDDMEHMDYVSNKEIQEILCRHKAKGQIGFADFEGDDKGNLWGYDFDGKGNMTKLVGKIVWNNQNAPISILGDDLVSRAYKLGLEDGKKHK